MSQEEKDSRFRVLRSVFLDNSVKRMKDIEELYPTYIAKLLGINYSRYIDKLKKPETFSIKQVVLLADLIDINPQIIMNIILTQVVADKKKKTSTK